MSARLSIICIWVCFILLLIIGIIMVASTSTGAAGGEKGTYELIKQSSFAAAGIAIALTISRFDYHLLRIVILPWGWGVCVFLLACCYFPGIGKEVNGEFRWLDLGPLSFQPSELAKSVLMITLAHWYTTHREVAGRFWQGFVLPGLLFGIPLLLILFEKDMGTAAALAVSGICMMYVAGARGWVLLLTSIMAFLVLYYMATGSHNRMERIYAWQDPQAHALGVGRQQWIAHLAISDGGLSGVGLGNSSHKFGSLPFANTDFIYAILGEEWGFIGSAGVLFLFTLMTIAGVVLALQIQDTFGRLLCVGLVCTIFWPAILNMLVVTAILPNTGLPLPFISYGGTNLVFTIISIGIITSIQRNTPIIRKLYWPTRRLQNKRH